MSDVKSERDAAREYIESQYEYRPFARHWIGKTSGRGATVNEIAAAYALHRGAEREKERADFILKFAYKYADEVSADKAELDTELIWSMLAEYDWLCGGWRASAAEFKRKAESAEQDNERLKRELLSMTAQRHEFAKARDAMDSLRCFNLQALKDANDDNERLRDDKEKEHQYFLGQLSSKDKGLERFRRSNSELLVLITDLRAILVASSPAGCADQQCWYETQSALVIRIESALNGEQGKQEGKNGTNP